MNRIGILIFISGLLLPVLLSGQGRSKERAKQRIVELRKNFIAEGLELDEDQSARFWPIYDRFYEQSDSIKGEQRIDNTKSALLSKKEAESLLSEYLLAKEYEMNLHINFYKDISQILPAKKILLMKERERLFHKKAFDRVRQRRKNRGEN